MGVTGPERGTQSSCGFSILVYLMESIETLETINRFTNV